MYTIGHHNNVYPGYTRYNEYSKYTGTYQQCIPLVIITMCIQGIQGIMNTVSIQVGNSNVYHCASYQCVSREHKV